MPDIKDLNNEELEEVAGGEKKKPSYKVFPRGTWLGKGDGLVMIYRDVYYIRQAPATRYIMDHYTLIDMNTLEYKKYESVNHAQAKFANGYYEITKPFWIK